jgi:hypothetical protein
MRGEAQFVWFQDVEPVVPEEGAALVAAAAAGAPALSLLGVEGALVSAAGALVPEPDSEADDSFLAA